MHTKFWSENLKERAIWEIWEKMDTVYRATLHYVSPNAIRVIKSRVM
jgi:hypothetical protein